MSVLIWVCGSQTVAVHEDLRPEPRKGMGEKMVKNGKVLVKFLSYSSPARWLHRDRPVPPRNRAAFDNLDLAQAGGGPLWGKPGENSIFGNVW